MAVPAGSSTRKYVEVPAALLSGKAADRITVTLAGRTFDAGRRTAAHLWETLTRFEKAFPRLRLVIAQPCYNEGYDPSAGTHDKDGVLDFYVEKADGSPATESDYWAVQRWMRNRGWAIWFRHTGSWSSRGSWHLHGISLGCPGPLGIYVDGGLSTQGHVVTSSQIADYYKHTYGLANQHYQDADKSAFPGDEGPPPWPVGNPGRWEADIKATIFDYSAWKEEHEMNSNQDSLLKQIAKDTKALRAYNGRESDRQKRRHDRIMAALDDLDNEVSDDATRKQVAKARTAILTALTEDDDEDTTDPGL